jgi:hypothetical protein
MGKNKKITYIFVNGINTTHEEAEDSSVAISDLIGIDVHLYHNETEGFFRDLWESFKGRRWTPTDEAKGLSEYLSVLIESGKKIVIFCHSQGGIVTSNAIRLLPYRKRNNISVICFASAQSTEPGGCEYYEYFTNKYDVLRWTMIRKRTTMSWGPRFIRNAKGHNLQEDYLKHLTKFKDFEKSFMYELISQK